MNEREGIECLSCGIKIEPFNHHDDCPECGSSEVLNIIVTDCPEEETNACTNSQHDFGLNAHVEEV